MIRALQMKNFRQHVSTTIEFGPGVNTIVGANGSGKSTIAEAIEFALYGARALRDTGKSYITDGCVEGSAVIQLDIMDHTYTVGRNSKSAEVRKDKVLDAQHKDNVTAYIASITGVNYTGFGLGHYVRQKELNMFSSLRAGKRHEAIERMLKINAIDKAISRLTPKVKELEILHKTLLGMYRDPETIESELDNMQIAKAGLQHNIVSIRAEVELQSKELEQQIAQQLLEANFNTALALREDLKACKAAAEELNAIAAEIELHSVGLKGFTVKVSALKELQQASKDYSLMQYKKEQLQSLKPVRPIEVPAPQQVNKTNLHILQTEANSIKLKITKLQQVTMLPQCPTCLTPLTSGALQQVIDDCTAELEAVNSKIADEQASITACEAIVAEETKAWQAYQQALAVYTATLAQQTKLESEIVEVMFSQDELENCEKEIAALQDIKAQVAQLEGKAAALQATASRMPSIQHKLQELDVPEVITPVPGIASLVASAQDALRNLQRELNTAIEEAARVDGRICELTEAHTSAIATAKRLSEYTEQIVAYKEQADYLVLFKRHLSAKIRPTLQAVAEQLFHKTTKNRFASYQLSSDYEIILTTHKGVIRRLATVSGSENDLACLCLRLAIATLKSTKLAGSLGFIILDEISSSFDDDRTRQTLDGLLELRDVIPQIINITHKPVEMRYADRLITVTEHGGLAQVKVEGA